MCDYSLYHVRTRPARIGDKLTTQYFGTGTVGFAAPEDESVAVCVSPGTELSFAGELRCMPRALGWNERVVKHKTAIFRQVNQKYGWLYHDALEFPDGRIVLLTLLKPGQQATVLQLPASAGAKTEQETGLPRGRYPVLEPGLHRAKPHQLQLAHLFDHLVGSKQNRQSLAMVGGDA